MDHVLFLAQEQLQSIQVKLNSSVSGVSVRLSSAKSSLSDALHNSSTSLKSSWVALQERASGTQFAGSISVLREKFRDSLDFKFSALYNRCFVFFLHEVSRTHVYLCCACFVAGGIFGVVFGSKLRRSVAAPLKMRAVVANGYSGLESIAVVEELDAPQLCSRDQVLVQVKAAGVDPVDLLISRGYGRTNRKYLNKYNPNVMSEFPVVLGRDCAGIVVAVGADVQDFHPGDQVWLAVPLHHQGTLSEYVVVQADYVAPMPPNLSLEGAASLPYSLMRAWGMLQQCAVTHPMSASNKRYLVHAGTCSVGIVLVQILKAWGGHVTTTVSCEAHAQLADILGADDVIIEGGELSKKLGLREKFDVILNTAGPALHSASVPHCLPEGVVVSAVFPSLPSDKYGVILGALCSLYRRVSFYVSRSRWCRGEWHGSPPVVSGAILRTLAPLVASDQLRPVVAKAYNCQDAEVALARMDEAQQVGKTIVRFSSVAPAHHLDDVWPDL